MKGISTIVATILMLVITIALAGTAYTYIRGSVSSQMQGLQITDSSCNSTFAFITLRNVGTTPVTISAITCTQTAPSADPGCTLITFPVAGVTTISPGASQQFVEACTGTGGRSCIYRITPPAGTSLDAVVGCS